MACSHRGPLLIGNWRFRIPGRGGLPNNSPGSLRTIRPEGDWCQQPKDITVSLNRLKRCYGEDRAPQRVDHDLRQLEDAKDNAEGPMRNAWVTNEGAAAAHALNQEGWGCPCTQSPGEVYPRHRTTAGAPPFQPTQGPGGHGSLHCSAS